MLFGKKHQKTDYGAYPPERYEPVLKVSICNGETVACVREKSTGKITELGALSSPKEIRAFCARFGAAEGEVRRIY